MTSELRRRIGDLAPARANLRVRLLAAGFGGGQHRAERRGSGVEFAGHRQYSPGDDLRHLDRHALLRHGRHLIREFHTETERALWLIVDASPSMDFASDGAQDSKRGFSLLLGAGLASLARRAGDPVGLTVARPGPSTSFGPRLGADQYQRLLAALEQTDEEPLDRKGTVDFVASLEHAARRSPRGSTIVVLSDLLDSSPALGRELQSLCGRRRTLVVVQVLDAAEANFPFRGSVRFQDAETNLTIDTEAERVREGYLQALERHSVMLAASVNEQGGRFVRVLTSERPSEAMTRIRQAIAGDPGARGAIGSLSP